MKHLTVILAGLALAACTHDAPPPLAYPPVAARDFIDCKVYAATIVPKHLYIYHGKYANEFQSPDKLRAATQECMAARGWKPTTTD